METEARYYTTGELLDGPIPGIEMTGYYQSPAPTVTFPWLRRGGAPRVACVATATDHMVGYGKAGFLLPKYMAEAGVRFTGMREYGWDIRIAIAGPRAWLIPDGRKQRDLVWHTMFEARPLPHDWVPILNLCGAIWAPSLWAKAVLFESGVTVPIYVAGYGVETYSRALARVRREGGEPQGPYTFLWCGHGLGGATFGGRKGGHMVVEAFRKLNLPDSRLILKVAADRGVEHVDDDRITVIKDRLSDNDYAKLHLGAHCFVYPSHGEGFGLQPLEAMGTGLPVIAPQYSGMADFIHEGVSVPLPVRGEEAAVIYEHIYGRQGQRFQWASISLDDVCDRMQWCYHNAQSAAAIGQAAGLYVAENWTWEQAGQRGRDLLEQLMEDTQ